MGANASSQRNKIISKIDQNMKMSCKPNAKVTQKITGARVVLKGSAKCDEINFINNSKVAVKCELDGVSDILASHVQDLTTKQKMDLGIGFNISSNENENKKNMKNYLEAKCGSSASAEQTLGDNAIELSDNAGCKELNLINNADITSQCVMKLVADATDNAMQKSSTDQTVKWDLLGIGMIIPIICCIICVISAVVFMSHLHYVLIAFGVIYIVLGILALKGVTSSDEDKEEQEEIKGWTQIGIGVLLILSGILWYFKFGKVVGSMNVPTSFKHQRSMEVGGNKKVHRKVKKSIYKRKRGNIKK
jgi:uncharacterized membrane protein YidH (DUF202 family)